MHAISDSEFQKNIAGIYKSIFADENPFSAPFQPSISHRLLLYPFTYGFSTSTENETEPWLIPFTRAVQDMGESGFYLSLLERTGSEPWHWYVPLSETHLYVDEVFPLENAIYSVNGRWGVICSDENHALLGGPESMVRIFRHSIQDWDSRLALFLNMWKQYYHRDKKIDLGWLATLIGHVYTDHTPDVVLSDPEIIALINKG